MDKIRLLWISASFPGRRIPHAGGQTFRYYFEGICRSGRFDVKLIAMNDGMTETEIAQELEGIDYKIIYRLHSFRGQLCKLKNIESKWNPWTKYAGLIFNSYARNILDEVKISKEKGYSPQIIILEWTAMVVLAGELRQIFPDSKIVASEHDVTFVAYARKKAYYSGIRGVVWEQRYLHEKKTELASLKLCDLILPHNRDNIPVLCSEGIERDRIEWLTPYFHDMSDLARQSNGRDILFFGAMGRPENYLSAVWFIEKVMPLLTDLDVRFVIAGGNPPAVLQERECERIHVTGFVDSIEPYFASAMCLAAPLVLGAGIKVKILEALSCGIPVMTNDIGIEGIDAVSGEEYIHCVKPEDYEKAIRRIYSGEMDVGKLEGRARRLVSRYDREKSLMRYCDHLARLSDKT